MSEFAESLLAYDKEIRQQKRIAQHNLETKGDFRRGVERGLDQVQALAGGVVGLAGDAFGIDSVRDAGFDYYQKQMAEARLNPASISRIEDIEGFGDAVDWFQGVIGEQIPNILSVAIGGGITGAIAKKAMTRAANEAIKRKAASAIARGATEKAALTAAKKEVGKNIARAGRNIGVVASSGGMEGGGMWAEDAEKNGVENANAVTAVVGGLAAGSLELFSPVQRAVSGLGLGKALFRAGTSIPKRIGKELSLSGLQEGLTEVGQEGISELNRAITSDEPFFTEDSFSRLINAFAAGAAIGGGFGAAKGALNLREEGRKQVKEAATVDDVLEGTAKVQAGEEIAAASLQETRGLAEEALDGYDPYTADLEEDFYETAADAQAYEDVKFRRHQFEKLKAEHERVFTPRNPSWYAKDSAAVFTETPRTPEMGKAERRADAREAFSDENAFIPADIKPAILKMENDLKHSDTGGVIKEGEGNDQTVAGVYPATTPNWFKNKTIKAYDKEHGTDYARYVGRKPLKRVLEKVRAGEEIKSKALRKNWEYLQIAAREEAQNDLELVAEQEYANLEKQGFEFEAPKTIPVGNLQEGDEVVIDKGGVPDKLKHKGYDKDYNAVLQDGVTIKAEPWDTIEIIGEKVKDAPSQSSADQETSSVETGSDSSKAATPEAENPQLSVDTEGRLQRKVSLRKELASSLGEEGVAALEKTGRLGFISSQEEVRKIAEEKARFSRENTSPWPADFPKTTLQTNLPKLKNHPDYEAAKAGNVEAAQRVITSVIKPEKIKALKERHPDAIVVAPHAEESSGRNALPRVFAEAFGDAGFEVNREIVQDNRPQRTKKGHELRLAMRPEFAGKVERGREYILLDDAVGQGGTASELRFFIEKNGGKVVGFSHLAAGRSGGQIAVQKPTLQKLKEKFGDERLNRFLNDFNIAGRAEALTEGEAKYLLKQPSLNSLRDRIFKGARENDIDLESWKVRSSLQVKYSKDGSIQGFVLDGKTYLVEDGIRDGHGFNVLAHEIGGHVRQLLFKDQHFQKLLSSLERRSKNNTASAKALRRAIAKVPDGTPAEHYWEEVAAYLVEDTANASIIREVLALVKKAVNELLGGRAADIFNEKDLRALAQIALKREVKQAKKDVKAERKEGASGDVSRAEKGFLYSMAETLGVSREQLEREYKAVESRYKGTDQWLKAPNGEPTNLNERQWVLVRTPRFKAWFGNWEMDRDKRIAVIRIADRVFNGDRKAAQEWLTDPGNGVVGTHFNEETGMDIVVSKRILQRKPLSGKAMEKSDSNVDHLEVLRTLPSLLKKASLAAVEPDTSNDRNILGVYKFIAPVNVAGKTYSVKMTVKDYAPGQGARDRFYTHELVEIEMPEHSSATGEKSLATRGSGKSALSVGEMVNTVNKKEPGAIPEASRVVDENDEPLVVYHGTDTDFTTFKNETLGGNTVGNANQEARAATSFLGHWFASEPVGDHLGAEMEIPVFLNIKDPYYFDTLDDLVYDLEEEVIQEKGLEDPYEVEDYYDVLREAVRGDYLSSYKNGDYDGIIIKDDTEFDVTSFVAFSPNQIKSATGNTGAFGKSNPDIRFSMAKTLGVSREQLEREYKAVEARYKDTNQWLKAPNGEPTNLNERQWVLVRTPRFRKWFGDWELAQRLAQVDGLSAIQVEGKPLDPTQAKEAYQALGRGKNRLDGREVRFVNSTLGKILRHKGFDVSTLIPQLKEVFESSVPIYSEAEKVRAGHKAHPNFRGYHNYLGKIAANGREYLVRFTVQEKKAKTETIKKGFVPNEMHSVFVTDVEIYSAIPAVHTKNGLATVAGESAIHDSKLQQFFEKARSAKKNASKIVDENGEPKVIYHGSPNEFTAFDLRKTGSSSDNGLRGRGFYLSSNERSSKSYGDNLFSLFAAIKEPFYPADFSSAKEVADYLTRRLEQKGYEEYSVVEDIFTVDDRGFRVGMNFSGQFSSILKDAGYDGVVYPRGQEVIAFSPNQIKSATGNTGAFGRSNSDIRFSRATGQKNVKKISLKEQQKILDWLDTGEPVATMKKGKVPFFGKIKELIDWVQADWQRRFGNIVSQEQLGEVVVDRKSAEKSLWHGKKRIKAESLYIVPEALRKSKLLGELPPSKGKPQAFLAVAPVEIGEEQYKMLMVVRRDVNMQRLYLHEVVLRKANSSTNSLPFPAASQKGAEPQTESRGAVFNYIQSIREKQAEAQQGSDIRYSKTKAERLEKLRNSKPVEITGKEIQQSDDIKQYKRNALVYGKTLRGTYVNKDTGKEIVLARQGIKEVLQHNYKDIPQLQSVAAIPQIIENGIYIERLPNEDTDKNKGVSEYEYYVAGLKIGGTDYTVKFVVARTEQGKRYYDHRLTQIEKGALLTGTRITNPVTESKNTLPEIKDKRLLQILQEENEAEDQQNPDVSSSKTKAEQIERDRQQKKGEAALEKLLREKDGEILGMHHPQLGDVYFVYGEGGRRGYGLAHLIEQREKEGKDGEAITKMMPEVIAQGEIVAVQGKGTLGERVRLSHKKHTAVLSLYRHGEKKVWLLTGWENEDGGAGVNPTTAYASEGSGISPQKGASGNRIFRGGEDVKFSKARTPKPESASGKQAELLKVREFLDGMPVVSIEGTEFSKTNTPLVDRVAAWFAKHYKGFVEVPGVGKVILGKRSVKDSIAHGLSRKKAAAFAAVPDVLTKGMIVERQENWKGRGYDSLSIVAPVRIGRSEYVALAVVRQDVNSSRFYLHEVFLKEKLQRDAFKTEALTTENGALNGASSSGAIKKLLQKIYSVKTDKEPSRPDIRFSKARTSKPESASGKQANVKPGIAERAESLASTYEDLTEGGNPFKNIFKIDPIAREIKKSPPLGFLAKLFSSPEYNFKRNQTSWRVFGVQESRQQHKFETENEVLGDFVQVLKDAKKNAVVAYKKANRYLLKTDRTGKGFTVNLAGWYRAVAPDGEVAGHGMTEADARRAAEAHYKDGKKEYRYGDYIYEKGEWWKVLDRNDNTIGLFEDEGEALKARMDAEVKYLTEKKFTSKAIAVVRTYREMTERAFEKQIQDLREIIETAKKNNIDPPTVDYIDESKRWVITRKGEKFYFETRESALAAGGRSSTIKEQSDDEIRTKVSVQEMIALMSDLRGTYFSRQRGRGEIILKAFGENGEKVLEKYDLHMMENRKIDEETGEIIKEPWVRAGKRFVNLGLSKIPGTLARRARELKAKGYEVTVERSSELPESVYDVPKLAASVDAILTASKKNAREGNKAIVQAAHEQWAADVALQFKKRGYMASRIQRAEDYWAGFEEDMLVSGVQYAKGLAAGIAKKQASKEMLEVITGRDISYDTWVEDNPEGTYEEYQDFVDSRRLDPGENKSLYTEVMKFYSEMFRNEESIDRVIGTIQGIAVLKFLGLRISSAAVNMTNMVMAVPAKISSHTNSGIAGAFSHIKDALSVYTRFRLGKHISLKDRDILFEITNRGWDNPQFNQDAAEVLMSKFGQRWAVLQEYSMFMFSEAEKVNRAVTILAAYKAHKKNSPELGHEELLKKAKHTSDRAHGIYGKSTRPTWSYGGGAMATVRLPLLFTKFSQNYLMSTYEDIRGGRHKEAAYMLLSPAILAGGGATLATPVLAAMAKGVGIGGDDPEEEFYRWAESTFGSDRIFRHGLAGLAGVNLKGSLQINNPMPTKLSEVFGAPGAVAVDVGRGFGHLWHGEFYKGLEALAPTAFGGLSKAVREGGEGITTGSYSPVYYGKEPLKATVTESLIRALTFNPARLSGIREKQWREKKVYRKFMNRRSEINTLIKRYYLYGSGDRGEILKEIQRYNDLVAASGRKDLSPIRPGKHIRMVIRRAQRPNRTERNRAMI